jgi:enamine deaminase RidA (YjgF/YER057c/UK114 family)
MELPSATCRGRTTVRQRGAVSMPTRSSMGGHTRCATFPVAGGCDESFVSIGTTEGSSFAEALVELTVRYSSALDHLGLSDASAVFSRVFLSDILNQRSAFLPSALCGRLRASCALSIIEQKPVGCGPLALLSYHIRSPNGQVAKRLLPPGSDGWRNDLVVKGKSYSLLLTANHTSADAFDAYTQTRAVFHSLNSAVEANGMTLLRNGIRTWVYVRDIDHHYPGMVCARRECLAEHGLTEKTRYLASTGILGASHAPNKIVSVDALSVGGLVPGQLVRMEALSHLGPTFRYGVTFERGLRVRFGDRSHLYVSGTASIDNQGEVLHEGNAELQARRAFANVRALLAAQSATLDDLVYVIAYVRNAHDRQPVRKVLDEELGAEVPLVFTEAAVCRPTWLMEIEGMAIMPDESDFPPFL